MKKSNKFLTITAAFIAATFGGCVGVQSVYGPPVEDPSQGKQNVQDVYGPPIDDIGEEEAPEAVYGPPPDELSEVSEVDISAEDILDEIEDIHEARPTVYGPPPDMFEPEPEDVEEVYGPPMD